MKRRIVALIATAILGSCSLPRTYECVDLPSGDCEAVATFAATATGGDDDWVVLSVDRQLVTDCTRSLPDGGQSYVDPCLPEAHELVAEVAMRSGSGQVIELIVVRERSDSELKVAEPGL